MEFKQKEKRKINENLGEIDQKKIDILDNIEEYIALQDNNMQIIWANKAAAKSVGLGSKEIEGCKCYELLYNQSKPCIGCPVKKAFATGKKSKKK